MIDICEQCGEETSLAWSQNYRMYVCDRCYSNLTAFDPWFEERIER